MTRKMERESTSGRMDLNTKEISRTTTVMDTARCVGKTVGLTRANG